MKSKGNRKFEIYKNPFSFSIFKYIIKWCQFKLVISWNSLIHWCFLISPIFLWVIIWICPIFLVVYTYLLLTQDIKLILNNFKMVLIGKDELHTFVTLKHWKSRKIVVQSIRYIFVLLIHPLFYLYSNYKLINEV